MLEHAYLPPLCVGGNKRKSDTGGGHSAHHAHQHHTNLPTQDHKKKMQNVIYAFIFNKAFLCFFTQTHAPEMKTSLLQESVSSENPWLSLVRLCV